MLPKSPWSAKEDRVLFDVVTLYGAKNWSYISQFLPGRTGKQCRERWHNHVDPNVRKGLWQPEEDQAILWGFKVYGAKWALIAKALPGRTDNSIKNRYNGHLKKLVDAGEIDLAGVQEPTTLHNDDGTDSETDDAKSDTPPAMILQANPTNTITHTGTHTTSALPSHPTMPDESKSIQALSAQVLLDMQRESGFSGLLPQSQANNPQPVAVGQPLPLLLSANDLARSDRVATDNSDPPNNNNSRNNNATPSALTTSSTSPSSSSNTLPAIDTLIYAVNVPTPTPSPAPSPTPSPKQNGQHKRKSEPLSLLQSKRHQPQMLPTSTRPLTANTCNPFSLLHPQISPVSFFTHGNMHHSSMHHNNLHHNSLHHNNLHHNNLHHSSMHHTNMLHNNLHHTNMHHTIPQQVSPTHFSTSKPLSLLHSIANSIPPVYPRLLQQSSIYPSTSNSNPMPSTLFSSVAPSVPINSVSSLSAITRPVIQFPPQK